MGSGHHQRPAAFDPSRAPWEVVKMANQPWSPLLRRTGATLAALLLIAGAVVGTTAASAAPRVGVPVNVRWFDPAQLDDTHSISEVEARAASLVNAASDERETDEATDAAELAEPPDADPMDEVGEQDQADHQDEADQEG